MNTPPILRARLRQLFATVTLAMLATETAIAADLSFPPESSAGHDFNHAPVGQTFTAVASHVHGGLFLADETSFTQWLSTVYPGQIVPGSYPYAVAPSVTVRVDLLAGEGSNGAVLHSITRTLTAPFFGFVDVDYGGAGVVLTVGAQYTLLLSDVSGQSYPQGVTGWVAPSVTDATPGMGEPVSDSNGNIVGYLPYGAYYGGLPVIQGVLVTQDAGVGDKAFQVIDQDTTPPPPPVDPLVISGANLSKGTVGIAYTSPIQVSGGVEPYEISVVGLPSGLVFDGMTVTVTGTPTSSGLATLTVTVTDALGTSVSGQLSLAIDPSPSNYTIRDESKGKINALGPNYLMVGSKRLIWDSKTLVIVNTPSGTRSDIDSFVKVGMKIQWKGLRDPATGVVLTTKIEIN